MSFASFGYGKGHLPLMNNLASQYDRCESMKREVEILEEDNESLASSGNSEKEGNRNGYLLRASSSIRKWSPYGLKSQFSQFSQQARNTENIMEQEDSFKSSIQEEEELGDETPTADKDTPVQLPLQNVKSTDSHLRKIKTLYKPVSPAKPPQHVQI